MSVFTIVIPVYNVEVYLSETIESVLNQTFRDIEVICVDDCSTDRSPAIIAEYAARDSRLKCIRPDRNAGSARARVLGTMTATGQFILYVDGDDTLDLDACRLLYKKLKKAPPDVLEFKEQLVDVSGGDPAAFKDVVIYQRFFRGRLTSSRLVTECVEVQSFPWSLHGQVFKTDLAKRASEKMAEVRIVMADDLYFLFIYLFYARTFRGIGGKRLYYYYVGRGITGQPTISRSTFDKHCGQLLIIPLLEQFLKSENAWESFNETHEKMARMLHRNCVVSWMLLKETDRPAALDAMISIVKDAEEIEKQIEKVKKSQDPEKKKWLDPWYICYRLPKNVGRILRKAYHKQKKYFSFQAVYWATYRMIRSCVYAIYRRLPRGIRKRIRSVYRKLRGREQD
jgi:glycosyltransferase involved in cell wall biosynthesis